MGYFDNKADGGWRDFHDASFCVVRDQPPRLFIPFLTIINSRAYQLLPVFLGFYTTYVFSEL